MRVDASLMEMGDEYAAIGNVQEPKWRVRALLMKLDSDDRNGTDYTNKFVRKTEEVFNGLPKPRDWQTFQKHDLPLLFTPDEVQRFALENGCNRVLLACHTQEEIAEAVEVASIQTISNWCDDFSKKLGTDNLINSPDFTPPIYNVWKRQADRDDKKSRTE